MRIICTKDEIEAGFETEYQADQFVKEYLLKGFRLVSRMKYYTGEIEIILRRNGNAN